MKLRNIIGGGTLVLGIVALLPVAHAASVDIEINTAPPSPPVVIEKAPAPRAGYIYEAPHYTYSGDKYVWKEGGFIQERPGHVYTPSTIEKKGDKWVYREGRWDND